MQPTMRQVWQASQTHLKLMLFDPYIWQETVASLRPISWQDGILTLAAPNQRARDICAIRLNRMIQREVSLEARRPVIVQYVIAEASHAL